MFLKLFIVGDFYRAYSRTMPDEINQDQLHCRNSNNAGDQLIEIEALGYDIIMPGKKAKRIAEINSEDSLYFPGFQQDGFSYDTERLYNRECDQQQFCLQLKNACGKNEDGVSDNRKRKKKSREIFPVPLEKRTQKGEFRRKNE